MSQTEILSGGPYRIIFETENLRNLPGAGHQGPQMTEITVGPFAGVYSTWDIKPAESENAFIITNLGSNHKAYVDDEQPGVPVFGFSEESTKWAIERTGSGHYEIKAVNKDLLWTVGDPTEDTRIILLPSNGSVTQAFRFESIVPN